MRGIACAALAVVFFANCGRDARVPERCRNLVQNASWENGAKGWKLPAFARLESGSVMVEGPAEGAIAQMIPKPADLSGFGVVALGYARVTTPHAWEANDDDVTSRLWSGTVALVDGYNRRFGGFESPYTPLRFTGREVASGCWKRFVTRPTPVDQERMLYPHFAFWQVRVADGVKLQVAALALVPAPENVQDPEAWATCPNLPAPAPVLASVTSRQWTEHLEPDGAFEAFRLDERAPAGERELTLKARYRQGPRVADRFLVAVTEDGSDPRLSPTSRVETILARVGAEEWQAVVKVGRASRPIRIAVAAAAGTEGGLRPQTPVLPAEWQKP